MTLEELLRTKEAGTPFALTVSATADGALKFYIHPLNEGGHTCDFFVEGNTLTEADQPEP